MGYFLSSPPADAETGVLRSRLEHGSAQERRQALVRLIALRAESALTQCLASGDPDVVRLAQAGLWECWLDEAGADPRRELETGIDAMNNGQLAAAAAIFRRLMTAHPDWAEACNKLATALYLQSRFEESIQRCLEVIALKPDHFGAWNGLALCAVQVENWPLAHRAVLESLRLQPRSRTNQQLFKLIESRLPPS